MEAQLPGANLWKANLSGANLQGADLRNTILEGIKLDHIVGKPRVNQMEYKVVSSYYDQTDPNNKINYYQIKQTNVIDRFIIKILNIFQ